MAESKEKEEGAHGFSVLLASLSSGYCHSECTEELRFPGVGAALLHHHSGQLRHWETSGQAGQVFRL